MATAKRTTTRRAAPAKTGAAPAVAKDQTVTVESDAPVAVDSDTPVAVDSDTSAMERAEAQADAEDARQQAQEKAEQAQAEPETRAEATDTASTVPDDEPAKVTEGVYGPAGTKEEPVITRDLTGDATTPDDEPEVPHRDLAALKALADTSGQAPVTPYPEGGVLAPRADKRMPVLRNTYDWTREGDVGAVGRILVDGFRARVNGYYRFGRKGDRIVAPADVIDSAVKRGVMLKEG